MTKQITIAVVVIFLLIVGVEVYFLVSKPSADTGAYSITITELNGSLSGTLINGKNTTQLDAAGVNQNALVTFNSPQDIMWVECVAGYTPSNQSNPAGQPLGYDPDLKAVIMNLTKGQQNTVSMTCTK